MSITKYIVSRAFPDQLAVYTKNLNAKDETLVDSFFLNSNFDPTQHNIELHIFALNQVRLFSEHDYLAGLQNISYTQRQVGKITELEINPEKDAAQLGYNYGQLSVLYNFVNNLYTENTIHFDGQFYIESISPDRKEILALSNDITQANVVNYTRLIREKLATLSYFQEFRLNFKDNRLPIGINIDVVDYRGEKALAIRLYEPLPAEFEIKDKFSVVELVSDSILFEIDTEIVPEEVIQPRLKGPNFDIELAEENNNPTGYFNYNQLFSYPVTSSYYELYSLFNKDSAQISINHADYGDFINFSSAEERLRNFKYKIDLITGYESAIDNINSTNYSRYGITGSLDYYQNLIKGVVNNFDHYDRFLFYESGSHSWPKFNKTRPYENQPSTTSESTAWFNQQIESASNFDTSNFNALTNTLPIYLREDTS